MGHEPNTEAAKNHRLFAQRYRLVSVLSQLIIDGRGPQPRVVPFDLGCDFSPSGEFATLIAGENAQYLLFQALSQDPGADGRHDRIGVAIVQFVGFISVKMGYPNDEGLEEHPLAPFGLEGWCFFEAFNSAWVLGVKEQMRQSAVRIWGYAANAPPPRHFILLGKELTVEVLAKGLKLKGYYSCFDEAILQVSRNL